MNLTHIKKHILFILLAVFGTSFSFGEEATIETVTSALDTGDTAWMLTSTLLVLLMTLPGLALFYGGLVRAKNVLSILMQCFVITAVMSLLWVCYGYALAAGEGGRFIGNPGDMFFLNHMKESTLSGTMPESVWVTFQMTFIIITPALMVGAFAERMKFLAVLIFSVIWTTLSYLPIWHMAWGGGLFHEWGAIDFAGGTVVHINAGIAGLLACIFVGKRKGYGTTTVHHPHNVPFVVIGASLLWVGWFGFNAGSAGGASTSAGFAMITTQVAAASAVLVWVLLEWILLKKPTAVGAATGAVAGLVAITPASGTSTVLGAIIMGAASSFICYFCATKMKSALKYDDSLDVFGVHGIGGIVGAILAGVFIREGAGEAGLTQVIAQTKSVVVTIAWSAVAAFIALVVAKVTVGLRVEEISEDEGLDNAAHGETGYTL